MTRTTVRGTAENAKAGAVIMTTDSAVVNVGGLHAWPKDVVGKPVSATGILETVTHDEPLVDENGLHRAGMQGDQTILRDAKWTSP